MEERDKILEEVVAEFSQRLNKALDTTELEQEERNALTNRYLQSFTENIKFAVMKTFGQAVAAETAAAAADIAAVGDEVTADDVEKMQMSLETAASRRSRYPEKCAKLLDRTLATNYNLLKILQVEIPPVCVPDQPSGDGKDVEHAQHLKSAVASIQDCKMRYDESLEKASRLAVAFNTLQNNALANIDDNP